MFTDIVRSHDMSGDQLEKLASLRADGAISDEEYQRLKAKVMAA